MVLRLCLLDVGDAAVRAAAHGNGVEFFLRLNLVGGSRFTVKTIFMISFWLTEKLPIPITAGITKKPFYPCAICSTISI